MDLPASKKGETALAIATGLLHAGARAGFTPALLRAGERCEPIPLEGGALLPDRWAGFSAPAGHARPIRDASARLRRGGLRVLISDMLWRDEPAPVLTSLSREGARLVVIHTLAREDLAPPPPGNYRLRDRETGRTLEIELDASSAQEFAQRASAFLAAARDACRRCAAEHIEVVSDAPDADWTDALLRRAVLVTQ